MAKDKDRTLNPAAAQRKADKQKALKKGVSTPPCKAQVAAQRTERLATRNPHRLETQIYDLHTLRESQGGKLNVRDTKHLEELERDVLRVKKARETLGDRAPTFGGGSSQQQQEHREGRERGRGGYGGLGKRERETDEGDESEETDEDVRRIPWPRDTPPPVPRPQHTRDRNPRNANEQSLGRERRLPRMPGEEEWERRPDTSLPAKPVIAPPKTTYESKPQVRDLRAEATKAFIPGVVRRKIEKGKGGGVGQLLEEEEMAGLEGEGYVFGGAGGEKRVEGEGGGGIVVDAAPDVGTGGARNEEDRRRLRDEEEAFEREIAMDVGHDDELGIDEGDRVNLQARVEEVSDDDM